MGRAGEDGKRDGRMSGAEADDELIARALRVMAAANFEAAVAHYADSMTHFRLHGPPLINKLLGQDTRFRTVTFTLFLHHDVEEGKPDAGATYSQIGRAHV